MIVTASSIFAGALLLFAIQPLTARRLLPWYGGSPAVWIVSLLFFQSVLLAGYAYAHVLNRWLARRWQAIVHAGLLGVALTFLPIGPHSPPEPSTADPTMTILGTLGYHLGIPLLVLSATNPLLQLWLSSSVGSNVYRLFALSNFGSLLGLLTYPFLFEPYTALDTQVRSWSIAFVVFAVLACWCAVRASRAPGARAPSRSNRMEHRALVLLLPATGSVLLLATSNQLTRNVASVPFLWVLPLSLYLLSFIVAFERDRWYLRPAWAALYLTSLVFVLHLLTRTKEPDFTLQLVVYSVNLLAGCMICHGELAKLRPRTETLTHYYLNVAFGGALGGVFVSLLAPIWFDGYWEYPIGLAAVYGVGGVAMLRALNADVRQKLYWVFGGIALGVFVSSYVRSQSAGTLVMRRSFFGVLRVYESYPASIEWRRFLWNGPVSHGGQFLAPHRRREPILYYAPETGVGLAMRYTGERFTGRGRRIGVVGLGTGSLALYGRPGDVIRFYEINPDVVEIAREYFYYLEETEAEVEIVVSDARLALAREEDELLDILVIDAFTGDAIPTHLLTREAFEIYERRLHPEGILAVHVSNLHIDLRPVVRAQGEAMGWVPVLVETDQDLERNLYVSDWVLLTRNAKFLSSHAGWTPWRTDMKNVLWTDDHSGVLGLLK